MLEETCDNQICLLNYKVKTMRAEGLSEQITHDDKEMIDFKQFFTILQVKFEVFSHISKILIS